MKRKDTLATVSLILLHYVVNYTLTERLFELYGGFWGDVSTPADLCSVVVYFNLFFLQIESKS